MGGVTFPGESDEYRKARNDLLAAEMELRQAAEAAAEKRRKLPPGGTAPEDYVFESAGVEDGEDFHKVKMTAMFKKPDKSLIVYSMMFGPDSDEPCSMCNSFMNSLNGLVPDLVQHVNIAITAKAPADKLRAWAVKRNWTNIPLYSAFSNNYHRDYHAEKEGANNGFQQGQMPMCNVFTLASKDGGSDAIVHTYGTEMLYGSPIEGGHNRHVDTLWPLWNFYDLTKEGRPNALPKISYD